MATTPSDKTETTLAENELSEIVSRETGPLRRMTDRGVCLATGEQTQALYRRFAQMRLPGVEEWVPADGVLLAVLAPGASVPPGLPELMNGVSGGGAGAAAAKHVIPVRFDGEDLSETADRLGLSEQRLAELLCSLGLRVKFLGFQPGFAYLEGLPPLLHLPRRAQPRKHVPAGSLALGGGYCGIYPSAGPGGWRLLGTTDIQLFDPAATPPARLQPGDKVSLVMA